MKIHLLKSLSAPLFFFLAFAHWALPAAAAQNAIGPRNASIVRLSRQQIAGTLEKTALQDTRGRLPIGLRHFFDYAPKSPNDKYSVIMLHDAPLVIQVPDVTARFNVPPIESIGFDFRYPKQHKVVNVEQGSLAGLRQLAEGKTADLDRYFSGFKMNGTPLEIPEEEQGIHPFLLALTKYKKPLIDDLGVEILQIPPDLLRFLKDKKIMTLGQLTSKAEYIVRTTRSLKQKDRLSVNSRLYRYGLSLADTSN